MTNAKEFLEDPELFPTKNSLTNALRWARAYIEAGEPEKSKQIIEQVIDAISISSLSEG